MNSKYWECNNKQIINLEPCHVADIFKYLICKTWTCTQSNDSVLHQTCTVHHLLTTLLDSKSIQSNIKGLVDSTLVRYHTVVDPWYTASVTVQSYHTRSPGCVEQPSCTIWWDFCSIEEVPVPSFCSWAAGCIVWSHTEQWIVSWSAELSLTHETMARNSCSVQQLQIDT